MNRGSSLLLFRGATTMNESAVLAVIRYIDKYLFAPTCIWPTYRFDERSYERWAADEIIGRLMDHPFSYPEDIVEVFAMEMDCYSRLKEDPDQNDIFRIAHETAISILDYLKGDLQ